MTTAGSEVRIRPPMWARVTYGVFLVVWVALFVGFVRPAGLAALTTVALVVAVASTARLMVMGVRGTADGRLVVRNQLSTRTFRRADLADAVVDRASWFGLPGSGWTVWLVLRDGSRHRVQFTERAFRAAFGARLDEQADRIRAGIAAGDTP
jgi:hypothetical protein